jgi:hypothetical protein
MFATISHTAYLPSKEGLLHFLLTYMAWAQPKDPIFSENFSEK